MTNLRRFTQARVSLGLAGSSLPTAPLLALRLAHAKARDAVQTSFDTNAMCGHMAERGWPFTVLESATATRREYLRRPDLGCRLTSASVEALTHTARSRDIIFAVSDGLSAPAAERHAIPLLHDIFAMLPYTPGKNQAIFLVKHGRVGIGDAIGAHLDANLLVLLIGERPGLSSPDSLGVYITWQPRLGRINAERNCVSNIHGEGLSYQKAAHKVVFLMRQMQHLGVSGVTLKDTSSIQQVLL